ncbi:hypothetical protein VTN02DRAFT_4978 [Thermoascus thermophilus]
MSRSATDATRFTATGPYASSKPASPSATPYKLPGSLANSKQSSSPAPGGRQETPKEKVERLRREARAARIAQSTSKVDQIIEGGRKIANKAHKAMIYTLIAASGVCGALTIYSVVSLTLYNRRQKALWLDKQLENLQNARIAYANGTATPEQLELLRQEKIGEIEKQKKEEAKAQRPWNRAKRYLFGDLKKEDVAVDSSSNAAPEEGNKPGVLEALNAMKLEDSKLDAQAAHAAVSSPQQQPGQLDQLAENVDTAVKQSTRSWMSWFTGR